MSEADRPFARRISREAIEEALDRTHGNLKKAAQFMRWPDGSPVAWTTFYDYARQYGLNKVQEHHKARYAHDALNTLRGAAQKEWKAAVELLNRLGTIIDLQPPPSKVENHFKVDDVTKLLREIDPEHQLAEDASRQVNYSEYVRPPINGDS